MSEVVKMETNNPSFLEGLQNYSSEKDHAFEQTLKGRMEIEVNDRMKGLLTVNDVLTELMNSLIDSTSDERVWGPIDVFLSSVKDQIWEEVRDNLYIR
jgi:hypothetical protein